MYEGIAILDDLDESPFKFMQNFTHKRRNDIIEKSKVVRIYNYVKVHKTTYKGVYVTAFIVTHVPDTA